MSYLECQEQSFRQNTFKENNIGSTGMQMQLNHVDDCVQLLSCDIKTIVAFIGNKIHKLYCTFQSNKNANKIQIHCR